MEKIIKSQQIKEIALAGISLSISIIFLVLTNYFAFSTLLIMLFIPLLTCLLSLKSHWQIQLLFLFGVLCVSFINIQDGIFYLLPNAVIGLLFGNFIKRGLDVYSLYIIASIVCALFNALSYFPILAIYDVDMISIYSKMLNLSYDHFKIIYPAFSLLLAEIEIMILILISLEEIQKFKYKFNLKIDISLNAILYIALLFLGLTLRESIENELIYVTVLSLVSLPLGIVILSFIDLTKNKKKRWFYLPTLLISIVLFCVVIGIDIKNINSSLFLLFLPQVFVLLIDENISIFQKNITSLKLQQKS